MSQHLHFEETSGYTSLGLFSGAGGLDLGFEAAGFEHTESNDILDCAVATLQRNRPTWKVVHADVREYQPTFRKGLDVLLAGFPCQGFSLGGKRDPNDTRNTLYREVVRVAKVMKPRAIVMENVLNLRTMIHPDTNKPFAAQIIDELEALGYQTQWGFFRVSGFGVPQTRRRFVFVAFRGGHNKHFKFPEPGEETTIRDPLFDLANGLENDLPNHDPQWGFESYVHKAIGGRVGKSDPIIPVRISRTASDGNPIRGYDQPFPAIDTATVWGWAQGNVEANRVTKDRVRDIYIRNPNATAKLWRIQAKRLRTFTAREYARLQTFPDTWEFIGNNKRDIQLQIGNAVPVNFAKRIALSVREALVAEDRTGRKRSMKLTEAVAQLT